jgi:septation ring formation regulator EzrA
MIMIVIAVVVLAIGVYMTTNRLTRIQNTESRISVLENIAVDNGMWPAGVKPPEGVEHDTTEN